MSKQRYEPPAKAEPVAETPANPEPVAAAEPVKESTVWMVTLNCPTPLREREAMIEAPNENAAWEAFKKLNGIGESDHQRTIVRA